MDITLEQVEELRRRANLSYEEARDCLTAANGSLLDALIALERSGRLPGGQGGSYSTRSGPRQEPPAGATVPPASATAGGKESKGGSAVRRFFTRLADILRPSSQNQFEIWRRGEMRTAMPILILVILAVFFWVTLPLLIAGLFFGFRYHFSGPDLGRRDLNSAMDKVSDTVDGVVTDLKREYHNKHSK